MNLFVGVIFDEFAHQKELENSAFKNMTEAQRDWKEMHPMIKKAKPMFNLSKEPTNKYRLKIYRIIKYWAFDPFIILLIILNIVTMGMTYY
jgi:hypothetical protein